MFWRWLTGRPSKALSSYGNAYKLIHKHPLSRNTSVYRFALPTEAHVLGLPVGQHLMLGLVGGGKDTPSRPYTPITIDRTTKGTFDLLIKTYPTGRLTPWIDQLKLGDEAFMSGPFGGFTYEGRGAVRINDEITGEKRRSSCQSFTMFAGGTGITPMYQLLQAIAVDDEDTTTVDLHFCNRSVGDVLLFEKLKAMEQASKGKFKITFYVDEVARRCWLEVKVALAQGPAPEGIEEGILTSAAVEEIIAGSDSTGMVAWTARALAPSTDW